MYYSTTIDHKAPKLSPETMLELLRYITDSSDDDEHACVRHAKEYFEDRDDQIMAELEAFNPEVSVYTVLLDSVELKLKYCPDNALVNIYNDYANDNCYEPIFEKGEFFETMLEGEHPEAIANMCFYGDYYPHSMWAMFDGCGNIKTFNRVDDEIDLHDLAGWILEDYTRLENFLYTDDDYE